MTEEPKAVLEDGAVDKMIMQLKARAYDLAVTAQKANEELRFLEAQLQQMRQGAAEVVDEDIELEDKDGR